MPIMHLHHQHAHRVHISHESTLREIPENESIDWNTFSSSSPKNIVARKYQFKSSSSNSSSDTEDLSSNLVLINRERVALGLPKLVQCSYLDRLAEAHAKNMAHRCDLYHAVSSVPCLQTLLRSERVGSNVQRGRSVLEMHVITMSEYAANRQNLLSPKFNEFGVGTAVGRDGNTYSCQYFRRIEH